MEPSYLSQPDLSSVPASAHRWALFLDFDSCFATAGLEGMSVAVSPETRYTLIRLFMRSAVPWFC